MQNVRISYRKPKLELYNTNKDRLSILTDRTQLSAYNIVLTEKINEVAELSFTIPFENTKITYDDCEKLIKFENEFYIIKNISVNDSNSRMMDVTCYHESVELKGLVCEPIDVIGATVEVMYMKILSSTSQKLSGYAWGGTDIPSTTKRHLQSENENSFFENLLSMAKVFDARLEFRSDAFGMIRIYIKKEDIDKGKYIKKGKDLKQLNIVYNSDEIFTRLTPYGATDSDGVELNILGINNGKSYVEDYSYYLAKGMTMDEILKTPKCLQMTVSRYSEIVDAKDLLRIAKEELSKHCVPQLNGSINILDFSIFENSVMTAPIIGERVTIINKDINFKLYAKITGVERNYDNPLLTKVQISNMVKYDSVLKDLVHQGDKIDRLTDKNGNITEGALKDPVTNLVADKVNFKDLTANNILFGTAVGGTLDLQTLLAKHISGENGQFLNITTENTTIKDAVIKDAMIESINAGKINAGTVNTNNVHIQSENGGIVISDNTQQFKDKNGNVRIQMGQDVNGEFNFAVFDETGTGTLIDATGIKEKALADGIIKDRMINEGEIGGEKINISSLITEINKDENVKTIKSSKVQLDTEKQTLDVAFKTLKTNVENIQVGGRNYALDTKNTHLEVDPNNYHTLSSVPFNLSPDFISNIRNKQITISALVEGEFDFTTEGSNVHWGVDICVNYVDGTSTWLNLTRGRGLHTTGKIPKKVYSFTTQVLDKEVSDLSNVNMFIRGTYTSITKFSIKDLKVEIGNKATDWTPAPEDIDSKIETNTTAIGVMQGEISTLIKDTTIEKNGEEIKLKDAYSKLDQTVDSISTTVSSHTTIINGKEDKNNRVIYARGTGLDYSAHRILRIGNKTIYDEGMRGVRVTALIPSTLNVHSSDAYDLHEGGTHETNFINKINELDNGDYIIIVTSYDNAYIHAEARANVLYKIGGFAPKPSVNGYREAYALIGKSKLGKGNGVEMYIPRTANDKRFAEVSVKVNDDGAFIGVNSSNIGSVIDSVEQRLEPDKIVATVKNHKTNGVNTFALSSQLTQTADRIVASFKSSGGYNLIRNSTGYNSTSFWMKSAGTLGTAINNNIGGATSKYMYLDNGTTTSERFAYSSRFKLKANTKYTLSGWFHNYTKCPNFDVYVLSSTSVGETDVGTSYTNVQQLIGNENTSGSWKKYSITFTTPADVISGFVRIDNNGYNSVGSGFNRVHWSALMLNEGEEQPWTPHPSEIYDGSTIIDGSGVTIKNGALKVENKAGQTVLSGDSNGNLNLKSVGNGLNTDIEGGKMTLTNTMTGAHMNLEGTSIKLHYTKTTDERAEIVKSGRGDLTISSWSQKGTPTIQLDTDKVIISNDLNVSNNLNVSGEVVAQYIASKGDVHTSGKISIGGGSSSIAPIDSGNGGKLGSIVINGVHNGWAGINFNSFGTNGMYQLINYESFGVYDTDWLWRNVRATFRANGKHKGWVGGYEAYRGGNGEHFRIAPSDTSGGMRFESYNTTNQPTGSFVFDEGTYLRPNSSNGYMLGRSSIRWTDVYCTRGAFNGSDSKLKENIKPVVRKQDNQTRIISNEPTSMDLYNYVKDTGVYTFNYKNTTNNMLGVLADEIPDNVFSKIGIMTKTEEEYQKELKDKEEAKKVLESTPMPVTDEEYEKLENTIVEGIEFTYKELKEKAEKTIEEPMRLINAPAQVSMLQEVLSMALNKIEILEQKNLELENDIRSIKEKLGI